MFDQLIVETNRYAMQTISKYECPTPFSLPCRWKNVTHTDMVGFLVILLHMGVVKKPCIADYWSTDIFIGTSFAPKIMPRARFQDILSQLHVANNEDDLPAQHQDHDPLFKINFVIDHLTTKFQQLYTPSREICIDEAICPFRGRLKFKVYIRNKPHKWGIKLYELCESGSSYVYNFEVYAMKKGLSNRPTDVCLHLIEPLINRGHWLVIMGIIIVKLLIFPSV
ncbi:PiggyBac transposable element-derived protein 4 [Plakobranchus ocellatus]|uniref:PiggyBac transposable element-derived protein 4 n=1 Tax=Plakobranchus ocellatus TaxID=259542 RepID=A0AAV4DNI8_9GAST|nr:PiggyBac transposable element-derived protein 4 [Plakobranchus ocellatus]